MILEIAWTIVALAGLARSIVLFREAVLDRRFLGEHTNGRRIVADGQVEHAWMGMLIYFFLLCPGVVAVAYKLGATSLEERLSLAPLFLVAALFALAIRQERDAYYRHLLLRKPLPRTALVSVASWVSRLFGKSG